MLLRLQTWAPAPLSTLAWGTRSGQAWGAPAAAGTVPSPSEKSIFIKAGAVPGTLPDEPKSTLCSEAGRGDPTGQVHADPPGNLPRTLLPLDP